SHPIERDEGHLGLEIPSGPGMHGFSTRYPLGAYDQAGEPDGQEEGDADQVTNRFGYGESEPSGFAVGSDIERLAAAVGRLSEVGDEDLPAVTFPEPAPVQEMEREPAREPAREPRGESILLVHHDERGGLKVDSFASESQAQAFVEGLLRQGVDRETIEAYRASRLDFAVSFRPVVHFREA
ncbi:MAG: hypothetical protein V3S00_02710, partial [Dehalococcoidia bacterium]